MGMKRKLPTSIVDEGVKIKKPKSSNPQRTVTKDPISNTKLGTAKKKRNKWKSKHGTVYRSSKASVVDTDQKEASFANVFNNNNKTTARVKSQDKRNGNAKTSSCMKHKKKDKKGTKEDKVIKQEKLPNIKKMDCKIKLPHSTNEISTNWQQLLNVSTPFSLNLVTFLLVISLLNIKKKVNSFCVIWQSS